MSDREQIWVIVDDSIVDEEPGTGGRAGVDVGGTFDEVPEKITGLFRHRVPVDAVALKNQMNGLLKVVGDLFEQAEQQTGMQLNEVTLAVEINGEGQVSLVGTGGKLGNKGGITLKFTRL